MASGERAFMQVLSMEASIVKILRSYYHQSLRRDGFAALVLQAIQIRTFSQRGNIHFFNALAVDIIAITPHFRTENIVNG